MPTRRGPRRREPAKRRTPDPRRVARALIEKYIRLARKSAGLAEDPNVVDAYKTDLNNQYVFARLEGRVIKDLVRRDQRGAEAMVKKAAQVKAAFVEQAAGRDRRGGAEKRSPPCRRRCRERFRTIHHIWPDFKLAQLHHRVGAHGEGRRGADLVHRPWRRHLLGGDGHRHRRAAPALPRLHKNIDVASSYHADFTGAAAGPQPLADPFRPRHARRRHQSPGSSRVAAGSNVANMVALWRELDENGRPVTRTHPPRPSSPAWRRSASS